MTNTKPSIRSMKAAVLAAIINYSKQHNGWFTSGQVFDRRDRNSEVAYRAITALIETGELQDVVRVEYRTSKGVRFRRKDDAGLREHTSDYDR